MNGNDIYKAMNGVDEALLYDAAPETAPNRTRWAAPAAACLAVALGGAMIAGHIMNNRTQNENEASAPTQETSNPEQTADATRPPEEVASEGFAEWMRFFFHNGEQYMECEKLPYDAQIIGDKVGDAYFGASITKKNEDYGELCGSVNGSVFEVIGVDPSIMLCWREGDGSLYTMLNTDKTDFASGRELYSDLLHIEDTVTLKFQSYGSWLGSRDEFYEPKDPENEKLTELIELMNDGAFASSFQEEYGKNTGAGTVLYFCRDSGLAIRVTAYPGGRLWLAGGAETMGLLYVDAERLDALLAYFKENSIKTESPTAEGRMASADDLRANETFGRFMPSYIPEDYDTVYYWIYRRFDNETGAITGTDRIEFEIEKQNDYIHFEVREGKGGREDIPTLEEVESGLNAPGNMGRYEVRLQRGGALIYLMAERGCDPQTVYDILRSIGE